jgi:hypothetical protein
MTSIMSRSAALRRNRDARGREAQKYTSAVALILPNAQGFAVQNIAFLGLTVRQHIKSRRGRAWFAGVAPAKIFWRRGSRVLL